MNVLEGDREPAVSARWIEALDRQATIIMAIFARAGFEPIAPAILQPADVFLDLIGEDLRQRTYVFTDPSGAELCLRPDLTIPACRLYLERLGTGGGPARFAYNGVVFRYQPSGASLARPREFRQAGIESFAADNPAKADAEILALCIESVRAAGLRAFRLHVGDLGIFNALLAAIPMPARWRARLTHYFWQPDPFRRQLQRLVQPGTSRGAVGRSELERMTGLEHGAVLTELERFVASQGLTVAGRRTLEEIAEQLDGIGQDLRAAPLDAGAARLIEAYLHIEAPAGEAGAAIRKLLAGTSIDIAPALAAFDARLELAAQEGIDMSQAHFSASFGRAFEYYTGFVFEIVSPALGGATPIGGGGRYDTLTGAISGGRSVAAVGAALHQDRLLLAVRGGRS